MTSPRTLNRHKNDNYVIIACLKICPRGKLINRISGSRLFVLGLPGSAKRRHVESLDKPCDVNKHSQSLAW